MKSKRASVVSAAVSAAFVLASAPPARGGEGIIELNQVCAGAPAGCAQGDSPGTPVELWAPGSYRLTSDLVSSSSGEPVIRVMAERVTLDLNGFSVEGVGAEVGGNGSAILGGHRVTVRNGFIRGASGSGVQLGGSSRVEDLHVYGSGRDGVQIAGEGTVRNVVATSNAGNGVTAGAASVIEGCTATANGGSGISLPSGTVGGSTATQNAGKGGDFGTDVAFGTNLFSGNGGGDVAGGRASGGNVCADRSCAGDGRRRFYLTPGGFNGQEAQTACAARFHIASVYELHAVGNLSYDLTRGMRPGHGAGPPTGFAGWAYTGHSVPSNGADCVGFNTTSGTGYLFRVAGPIEFNNPSTMIAPWLASGATCTDRNPVWCIED